MRTCNKLLDILAAASASRCMVWMMGKENSIYNITHIYSGEKDKCSALVTRNNKIKLLEHEIMIMIKLLV